MLLEVAILLEIIVTIVGVIAVYFLLYGIIRKYKSALLFISKFEDEVKKWRDHAIARGSSESVQVQAIDAIAFGIAKDITTKNWYMIKEQLSVDNHPQITRCLLFAGMALSYLEREHNELYVASLLSSVHENIPDSIDVRLDEHSVSPRPSF